MIMKASKYKPIKVYAFFLGFLRFARQLAYLRAINQGCIYTSLETEAAGFCIAVECFASSVPCGAIANQPVLEHCRKESYKEARGLIFPPVLSRFLALHMNNEKLCDETSFQRNTLFFLKWSASTNTCIVFRK